MTIKCNNECTSIRPLTFEPLELGLTPVLAQRCEELIYLLEGQRVVQCLQWIDGRHQGATFKPCINTWFKTQSLSVAAIITEIP